MRIVSGLNRLPTGCCIQALAIRIQRAEKFEPNATHQVTARWPDLLSRSHPKKNNPMKVASRKNAIRPCNGERRAEHVADVVREVGPVRAELKFAAVLDLSWVRAELAPYYSSIGRPSIDPVLMIRMLIVGYVFAIRSERLLAIQARRAVTGNSEGTVEAAPGTGAKLEGRP